MKQSDIRQHLIGASSRFNEDDPESKPRNKEQAIKKEKYINIIKKIKMKLRKVVKIKLRKKAKMRKKAGHESPNSSIGQKAMEVMINHKAPKSVSYKNDCHDTSS